MIDNTKSTETIKSTETSATNESASTSTSTSTSTGVVVIESVPARVEVVKGGRDFPSFRKGLVASVRFEVVELPMLPRWMQGDNDKPERAVRVHFGSASIYMSGRRVKVPKLEIGKEFNLHNGDPTRNIRIRVIR